MAASTFEQRIAEQHAKRLAEAQPQCCEYGMRFCGEWRSGELFIGAGAIVMAFQCDRCKRVEFVSPKESV